MTKDFYLAKGAGRKYKWLVAVCVVAIMLAAVLPISALAASTGTEQYIDESQAKSTALNHAGVTEAQATFIKTHLDYDDGRVVYDIEFYSGDTEYDYEIDAVSGEIYEFDREIEYYSIPNNSTGAYGNSVSASTGTGSYIGEAKAKTVALNHAGVAESQTRKMKVKLDREHGTMVYEVEFKSGQMEYEYEINATSGDILESDIEHDD